jgi:CrcB protein
MVITFVDEDERVNKTLTALRKKIKSGFIVVNQVEIWK